MLQCLLHSMHIDYYLVANGLSCVCRWYRFRSTTCTLFLCMPALQCSESSLSQQSDALVPSVLDAICRNYAQISRQYLSIAHPYRLGDRCVFISNRALHLVLLATPSDLCYRKRATPARLAFPPFVCPVISFFGCVRFSFVRLMMMWS